MSALPTDVPDLHRRFYDAALDLLAEEGYGALKQRRLVERMGLTTGAFFHSFASWKEFTTRLLDYWHADRTLQVMAVVQGLVDADVQIEELIVAALGLRHEAESAIRAWAGSDPDVLRVLALVDAERLEIVTSAMTARSGDPELATRLARTALYILVGFEQVHAGRDDDTLEWALRLLQGQLVADHPTYAAPSRGES